MKNQKNSLLIVLAVALLFIGCTNKNNNGRIVFAHTIKEAERQEQLRKVILEFEVDNRCVVEIKFYDKNDFTALYKRLNSDKAYDVIMANQELTGDLSVKGLVRELNRDTFRISESFDLTQKSGEYKNKLYSIPFLLEAQMLYCNRTLFTKAGISNPNLKTLDQLSDYAKKISSLPDFYGYGAVFNDNHKTHLAFLPFLYSFGTEVIDKSGNLNQYSQKFSEALSLYKNLAQEGVKETSRQIQSLFIQGKIGMCLADGRMMARISKENPKLDYFIALFPGISHLSIESLFISGKTKNEQLARKLINYLTNSSTSLKLTEAFPYYAFPANKQALSKIKLTNNNLIMLKEQLYRCSFLKPCPGLYQIENKIDNCVTTSLLGEYTPPINTEEESN